MSSNSWHSEGSQETGRLALLENLAFCALYLHHIGDYIYLPRAMSALSSLRHWDIGDVTVIMNFVQVQAQEVEVASAKRSRDYSAGSWKEFWEFCKSVSNNAAFRDKGISGPGNCSDGQSI